MCLGHAWTFLDFNIIESYLQTKGLNFATVYNCLKNIRGNYLCCYYYVLKKQKLILGQHKLYTKLMAVNKRIIFINISNGSLVVDRLDAKFHTAVIFDGDCEYTQQLLVYVSTNIT